VGATVRCVCYSRACVTGNVTIQHETTKPAVCLPGAAGSEPSSRAWRGALPDIHVTAVFRLLIRVFASEPQVRSNRQNSSSGLPAVRTAVTWAAWITSMDAVVPFEHGDGERGIGPEVKSEQ
jgi:hypothetical protein